MKVAMSIIALLLCLAATAGAQVNYPEISGYSASRMALQKSLDKQYLSVEGSPYLYKSWSAGRILLVNDTVGAEYRIRFNVYGNEMQFINKSDTLIIANPQMISAILLDGHRFEYLPYFQGTTQEMTYFEVIAEGKVRLLVRHSCRLDKGSGEVTPYSGRSTNDRFISEKFFYYQTVEMESPGELPLARNTFLSLPGFNTPDVKEYMTSQKIKLRNEQDLLKLFTWINQPTGKY